LNCYYCDKELREDNKSKEHIIPDSLGGKGFYSYDLLCKKCNSDLGSTVDHDLIEQIGFYADIINVSRDRRSEKLISGLTAEGERYTFSKGLKPAYEFTFEYAKGKFFTVYCQTEEDVYKIARKKIKELQKKGEKIDIEEELKRMRREVKPGKKVFFTNKLLKEYNKLKIGSSKFFKGVAKIAVNYYIYNGGESKDISVPIDYLKGRYPQLNLAEFYYPEHHDIHKVNENEISHLIYLKGDVEEEILYCYIELFNAHNSIVLLEPSYKGKEIEVSYCYDFIAKTKVEKEITFEINRHDLANLLIGKKDISAKQRHQEENRILIKKIEKLQEKFQ